MIDKIVRRSILKNKGIFISINLMFILTVTLITVSVYAFFYSINNYNEYTTNTNLEDFRVNTYEPLTNYQINEIEHEYNLELQYRQYYDYKKDDVIITINPEYKQNSITKPIIIKGRGIRGKSDIVISQEFAHENNINIGSKYKISSEQFEVVGLASYPTLMYPIKDTNLFPNNKTVGEVYISDQMFEKIKEPIHFYVGKFKENLTKKERLEVYETISLDYKITKKNTNIIGEVQNSEYKKSNFIKFIDVKSNPALNVLYLEYLFVGAILGGLGLLIGVISIFLSSFLFKSIVQKNKRDIGIIRAEGYYVDEIITSYITYFSYGLLFSIVCGILIGSILSILLESLYNMFFNIIRYTPDAMLFIVLIVVSLTIFLILNIFIRKIISTTINENILNLINNTETIKAPKSNFKKTQNKIKFSTKLKFITIFRNKAKTLLLIYGVFFSVFLTMFYINMGMSVLRLEENLRGDSFTYDYIVSYSETFTPALVMHNEESIIIFNPQIKRETNEKELIKFVAYNEKNKYFNMDYPKANQVNITSKLAKELNLKTKDTITLINPGNKNEEYKFEINQILDVSYENAIYGSDTYIKNILDLEDTYYNGLVGAGSSKERVMQGDKFAYFYSYNDFIEAVNEYSILSSIAIVYVVIVASIISIVTIVTTYIIIINANKKQIYVMKILGYSPKEINNMIFGYYKWIVIVVYIISYPLSIHFINYYLNLILSLIPDITYPIVVKYNIYVFLIGLIYIYVIYYISTKLTIRKINKENLSESIKKDV